MITCSVIDSCSARPTADGLSSHEAEEDWICFSALSTSRCRWSITYR